MFQSGGIICSLVIFGFLVLKCDARHGMNQSFKSISCYECNSAYDPRCGDPFDPYTIGIVNCSKKRPLEHIDRKPTLCRKTIQKVQGHTRIIRGCGYVPDATRDGKECIKRSGTHDVHVLYCSCKHGLCNTGHFETRPSNRIVVGAFVLVITSLLRMA